MSHTQAAVLCDVISRGHKFIDTFCCVFLMFQWNTGRKEDRKMKRNTGVMCQFWYDYHTALLAVTW